MKKRMIQISCICLFLGGVIVFSYPDIRAVESRIQSDRTIREFEERLESSAEDETDSSGSLPLEELRAVMQDYNRQIYAEGQENLKDPWSYEQSSIDLTEYGMEDEVIGIISIPKMKIELPIYLGASQENMKNGAVLLGQTSFPLGENNSNSVIAAHRGWKGIPMFREIEQLEPGDTVTIHNFWENLTYEVTGIKVIMPEDINEILIQDNRDMITLLTCHPYTQNVRRYVVFCERVNNAAPEETDEEDEHAAWGSMSEENEISVEKEDAAVLAREKMVRRMGYVILGIVGVIMIIMLHKNRKVETERTDKH